MQRVYPLSPHRAEVDLVADQPHRVVGHHGGGIRHLGGSRQFVIDFYRLIWMELLQEPGLRVDLGHGLSVPRSSSHCWTLVTLKSDDVELFWSDVILNPSLLFDLK